MSWFTGRLARSRQPDRESWLGSESPRTQQISERSTSAMPASITDPDPVAGLDELVRDLVGRFPRTGNTENLDRAITAARKAVNVTPHGDQQRANRLTVLGGALTTRFERLGHHADLDAAIVAMEEVAGISAGDPDGGIELTSLAVALRARSRLTGNPGDPGPRHSGMMPG
jgi:hypothetical protein